MLVLFKHISYSVSNILYDRFCYVSSLQLLACFAPVLRNKIETSFSKCKSAPSPCSLQLNFSILHAVWQQYLTFWQQSVSPPFRMYRNINYCHSTVHQLPYILSNWLDFDDDLLWDHLTFIVCIHTLFYWKLKPRRQMNKHKANKEMLHLRLGKLSICKHLHIHTGVCKDCVYRTQTCAI